MSQKFKKGDLLKCTFADNNHGLTNGAIYKAKADSYNSDVYELVEITNDRSDAAKYNVMHFTLHTPKQSTMPEGNNDPVNRPSHYTDGRIEVIDFIEDKRLGYHLGNTVKYVCRAGKKDPAKEIEDLKKAQWYLNRRIESLENK